MGRGSFIPFQGICNAPKNALRLKIPSHYLLPHPHIPAYSTWSPGKEGTLIIIRIISNYILNINCVLLFIHLFNCLQFINFLSYLFSIKAFPKFFNIVRL